jgi:hypothetical protein
VTAQAERPLIVYESKIAGITWVSSLVLDTLEQTQSPMADPTSRRPSPARGLRPPHARSGRMVYRLRCIRYVGEISPPHGSEGQSTCSSATATSSQTAQASPTLPPWSPQIRPRGPILGRIGPRDRGCKPPLTCGDAVEPPIGIEPMTYSLRGSYIPRKHSAGWPLPRQPTQFSWVGLTRSKSCMTRTNPRLILSLSDPVGGSAVHRIAELGASGASYAPSA